ncbi:hypothetical protein ACS0TY_034724 [Phlomoides rotata]
MLPESLGNLEKLEDLDISDNQIKALPDSFRFLSRLRNFRADQTSLEIPPREVMKLGAHAVVQYMADYVLRYTICLMRDILSAADTFPRSSSRFDDEKFDEDSKLVLSITVQLRFVRCVSGAETGK